MKKLILSILLLVASCSTPATKLTADDILLIPESAFPDGWRQVSINHESEFGTPNVFQVQYSTDTFQGLVYWFIYYEDVETAETAFVRYRTTTFPTGIDGKIKWDEAPPSADFELPLVDEHESMCRQIMRNNEELQSCAAQIRYNNCIIKISSQIDDVYMSLADFYGLLEYIDSNMSSVYYCG